MPPIRNYKNHDWTNFEMHTMLCLIAKGVHLEESGKRSDAPNVTKNNAYLTFATKLNDAVHGSDYEHDIHRKEVTRMLDEILLKHKGVIGKGGLAERQFGGRITRSLRLAWQRSTVGNSPLHFDGSVSEWNQWRREKEKLKLRIKLGLPPQKNVEAATGERVNGVQQTEDAPSPQAKIGRQAQKLPRRNRWRGRANINALSNEYVPKPDQSKIPVIASEKIVHTNLDSFSTLPGGLQSLSVYQWANPDARQTAFLSGRGGRAAIAAFQKDSYQPNVESSKALGEHRDRGSTSSRATYDAYLPPNNSLSSAYRKSSGHTSSMSAAKSRGGSDSVPSLTHDYSSSDGVEASGYSPPTSSGFPLQTRSYGSMDPLDLNGGNSDALADSLGSDISTKLVDAEQTSLTKVMGDDADVEMDLLPEGKI